MSRMHRRLRSRRSRNTKSVTNSPEVQYMRHNIALWCMRAVANKALLDSHFFECLEFALGGLTAFAKKVSKAFSARCTHDEASFNGYEEQKSIFDVLPKSILSNEECVEMKEELQRCSAKRLASYFEDLLEENDDLHDFLQLYIIETCAKFTSKKVLLPKSFSQARQGLRRFFGSNKELIILIEFVHILRDIKVVERYFEDILEVHKRANIHLFAKILDMSAESLRKSLNEAAVCIFQNRGYNDPFYFGDTIEMLWFAESLNSLEELFYQRLKGKTLPLESFNIPNEDVQHVRNLFEASSDEPLHILLYGPPGTGKTSFAHSLAKTLNVKAWSVVSREDDDEGNRRSSLMACMYLASKHNGAFVLVDEAERLLDTEDHFFKKNKDKAWLNRFLEQAGRRVIWITNHIDHIDQAVRRRFAFSLHFEELTIKERQNAWQQILAEEHAQKRMETNELEHLVQQYPVSVAVVSKSVKQAKRLGHGKATFAKTVECILEAHTTLCQNGQKRHRNSTKALSDYTLDGVTMQGDAESFMKQCRRLDTLLTEKKTLPPAGGTMLFYGPPGTGKTALARYMAKELGRECIVKRASDLLSKYVGEAEKNIASAFRQAERDGSVLVIDEADSFIYSRDMASRSWELTQVNEFLTALEEYRGLCICTSNRRETMDAAAMRRFAFKIPFTYAKGAQLEALYASILAPLVKEKLLQAEVQNLQNCTKLTPGDFAAVRSQYWLNAEGELTHRELINALMKEQKMKLDVNTQRMGF